MKHIIDAANDDLPSFERTHRTRAVPARFDNAKPKGKRPWRGQRSHRTL